MMAFIIVLAMLFLAAWLTIVYFPRMQKPQFTRKNFHFETADDLAPKLDITHEPEETTPKFKVESLESPPFQYEIPNKYNEDRIALLVRDPEWLFTYWETSHSTKEFISTKHDNIFNESVPVVRVYNITDSSNSPSFFDICIDEDTGRCHIHVKKPNNKYYVAVGRRKHNGEFVPILYSNVAVTPRSEVSPIIDKDWLPPFGYEHLLYNAGSFSSYEASKERND